MGGNKYRVFVDGKPIHEEWRVSGFGEESFEAEPDGSLAVLLQNETSINRVKITPSPSTSLATLLAGAVPNAKKHLLWTTMKKVVRLGGPLKPAFGLSGTSYRAPVSWLNRQTHLPFRLVQIEDTYACAANSFSWETPFSVIL